MEPVEKGSEPATAAKIRPGVKDYGRLLRVPHYIKNLLVFVPLFFSIGFLRIERVLVSCAGFVVFSLLSSIVYIINDIRDLEKDRLHSVKRNRPLASGRVPVRGALGAVALLSVGLLFIMVFLAMTGRLYTAWTPAMLALYLFLNIGYSLGLKNIPIVDITILASGFVIRVLFGAFLAGVDISVWLYLTVTVGAYYLGLGKRRNEITRKETGARRVIQFYSHNFLDKNMYVCQTLCLVFYALWSIDAATVRKFNSGAFVYTIPLILVILLRYSLDIEADSDGDPVPVLLRDRTLIVLCVAYLVSSFGIIYFIRSVQ